MTSTDVSASWSRSPRPRPSRWGWTSAESSTTRARAPSAGWANGWSPSPRRRWAALPSSPSPPRSRSSMRRTSSMTPRRPPSCSRSRPRIWRCSAGGAEKGALCASLGADLVVDHLTEDFVESILTATDDVGADVVYDLTGGDFAERSWRCTARGGRYLAVGFADDENNGMTGRPLRMACIGNIDIVGVMVAWAESVDPGMRRFGFNPFGRDVADEIHADLLRLVSEGTIRPYVGRRVTMEEAGTALDAHEDRRSLGRTVVEIVR